jgi:hypothetical protein
MSGMRTTFSNVYPLGILRLNEIRIWSEYVMLPIGEAAPNCDHFDSYCAVAQARSDMVPCRDDA